MHAFLPDVVEQFGTTATRCSHRRSDEAAGVRPLPYEYLSEALPCRPSVLTAQAASNRLTQQRNRRFDVPALGQIFRKGAFIADRLDLALFIETRDFGDFKSQR